MDIKYSSLTKENLNQDLRTINENQLDNSFKDFYNSKYGSYITDVFSSFVGNANYNINRRFEESFNETAKLDESQIMLSHDKGYDIQRNVPAKSQINPSPNNPNNFSDVDRVIIEKGTSFSIDDSYFTLTQDINITVVNGSFSISTPLYNCLEGVLKTDVIDSEDFSAYLFTKFGSEKTCNVFGSTIGLSDQVYDYANMSIGEVDENGDDVVIYTYEISDGEGGFTTIDRYNYLIERVLNYNSYDILLGYNNINSELNFQNAYELSIYLNELEADSNKVLPLCYVRTSRDKLPELCFTDGRVTRFPRNSIKVKYFTSNGSLGNKSIVNRKCTLFKRNATVYINGDENGIHRDENTPNAIVDDILNNIVFTFSKNSIDGIEMESAFEISTNMDAFFSMQDRLVTSKDFNTFFGRSIYKGKLMNFWGESTEREFFQDITAYNNNTIMLNYKGVNEDIFNNLSGDNSVDLAGLFFNNLEGFASKYYIDDLSVVLTDDVVQKKQINLKSYKDYLYMYFLREILPLKLLSNVKNDNMGNSSILNKDLLLEMNSIVRNTGNLALNYTYVPSLIYDNIVYSMKVTIQGSSNANEGGNNTLPYEITTKIKDITNTTRGLETSKLVNQLTSEYRSISNIETTISIDERETTASEIVNNTTYGNNIFEDAFITYICSSNKGIYDLFVENDYFSMFPSIKNMLGFNKDNLRLVEGYKNVSSARRLASIYRETFRFMFVMQINGFMNDLSVDDIYSRTNNFYEFVEVKMKYDVIKNLSKSTNSLDYTEFTLPNEFIDVESNINVSVTYKDMAR